MQEKQHKRKMNTLMKFNWEVGEYFRNKQAKCRAILKVEEMPVIGAKISTLQATTILSDLVAKLAMSDNSDKNEIQATTRLMHLLTASSWQLCLLQ